MTSRLSLCALLLGGIAGLTGTVSQAQETETRPAAPSVSARAPSGLQARLQWPYAVEQDPVASQRVAQYPPPLRDPDYLRPNSPGDNEPLDGPVGSGIVQPAAENAAGHSPQTNSNVEIGPATEDSPNEASETVRQSTETEERSASEEAAAQDSQGSSASESSSDQSRELTAEMQERRDQIRLCLARYYREPVRVAERSPWGIMHALIAYGVDTQVYANNQRVNAIGWLCWNGSGHGMRLFYTSNGRIQTRQGPGVEGHEGQFLAMLAQSKVRTDFGMKIDGYDFTVADLIEHEKRTCKQGTELTFKLIALSHYLPSDATWTCDRGQEWSIPRLIREELAQSVVGAACGGTHRMMGFSYAVRTREKRGEPMTGQWLRAKQFVDDYIDYTLQLQNPDGSFSTNWFKGRGDWGGVERRLETTGHILEWLVYSLPEDQLDDPRVIRSVDFLTNLMLENQSQGWEIGPRGHALHALALYDERVFEGKPGERAEQLAEALRNVTR